jgi:hypothetical protein
MLFLRRSRWFVALIGSCTAAALLTKGANAQTGTRDPSFSARATAPEAPTVDVPAPPATVQPTSPPASAPPTPEPPRSSSGTAPPQAPTEQPQTNPQTNIPQPPPSLPASPVASATASQPGGTVPALSTPATVGPAAPTLIAPVKRKTTDLEPEPPEAARTSSPITGGLIVRTDFPTFLGGVAFLEFPDALRLRFSGGVGILPSPYAKTVNSLLRGLGAYDDKIGEAYASSLQSSLAVRALLSFKPLAGYGFTIEAGYGLAQLNAKGDALRVAEAEISGVGLPPEVLGQADTTFQLKTTMHGMIVGLAWEFEAEPGFVFGIHLNLMKIMSSKTKLAEGYESKLLPEVAAPVKARFAEFDDSIVGSGYVPHLGLSAGYKF